MAQIKCFDMLESPKGGASTINYLMEYASLIPKITEFTISGRPFGLAADHAYLQFDVKDGGTLFSSVWKSQTSLFQTKPFKKFET